MQMIAEAYDMLQRIYGLDPVQIANVFEGYNEGRLESYLFEISVPVLKKEDDQGKGFLIEKILDKAGQKGTGKWTAIDALERGVTLSSISEAVFARTISSHKGSRVNLSANYPKPAPQTKLIRDIFIEKLENTLYAVMLTIYTEGFDLIKTAAEENKWQIDFAEIARIWQGGCIIRARLLEFLEKVFQKSPAEKPYLLELDEIVPSINKAIEDWREIVSISIESGIPSPVLTSALQYLDATTTERLPANLIQGLRDYFGAHTYERTDKEGNFHTEWNE